MGVGECGIFRATRRKANQTRAILVPVQLSRDTVEQEGEGEGEGEVMRDDSRADARQSARRRCQDRESAHGSMLNLSRYAQRLTDLVHVAAVFAVMAAICFAAAWVIEQLQSLRCPAGTFLVGSEDGTRMLQRLPILVASFFLGILTVEWSCFRLGRVKK